MAHLSANLAIQGESVYAQAQKELAEVGEDASKGFTDLRESILNRTRSLSVNTATPADGTKEADDAQSTPTKAKAGPSDDAAEQSETVLSRLRTEATKRLKDLQKAEDAADEALLRFGSNVRDFLRDAISVAPPDESSQDSTVLFESKDAQGKRVIHTSRFDAQMHVIHTSVEGFAKDPTGDEYEKWTKDFDVEKKTDDISGDLAKYPELRVTMEKLVPDQVTYADFWKRYYFLRHGIETAESRRRDLLKGIVPLIYSNLLVCTNIWSVQQPPLLTMKLAGTMIRTTTKRQKRRHLAKRLAPEHRPPLFSDRMAFSSQMSPENPMTRSHRLIAKPAMMS